ncbi:nucleocapsid protein [Thimiri virus]|uniref:Nucleoprotein n=1 Tax=Orthobunyavirus thimiriense TaxID=3052449 RepID=A0A346JEZ7_9VIRU|nr:nucleocapsid protein [Orthobunyavirus thimiriense]AXP32072.1 nucleocapsid protein [Orthobunyavirus thimiriense]
MSGVFVFDDVPQRTTSTFDPEKAYVAFEAAHGQALTVDTARVFFLNQKRAKDRLRQTSQPVVDLTFNKHVFRVVNNHFPQFQSNPVGDADLTLHRLSGYIAVWLAQQVVVGGAVKLAEITSKVIIPLAEVKGCTWNDGAGMYLSFASGTEMFLETFTFYPLAIEIQRVLKDGMDVTYMRKVLRQRYGKMTAEEWMRQKLPEITAAVKAVEQLPWARSGFSAQARAFLAQFNIKI